MPDVGSFEDRAIEKIKIIVAKFRELVIKIEAYQDFLVKVQEGEATLETTLAPQKLRYVRNISELMFDLNLISIFFVNRCISALESLDAANIDEARLELILSSFENHLLSSNTLDVTTGDVSQIGHGEGDISQRDWFRKQSIFASLKGIDQEEIVKGLSLEGKKEVNWYPVLAVLIEYDLLTELASLTKAYTQAFSSALVEAGIVVEPENEVEFLNKFKVLSARFRDYYANLVSICNSLQGYYTHDMFSNAFYPIADILGIVGKVLDRMENLSELPSDLADGVFPKWVL